MTKFVHVGLSDVEYENLINGMTASEKSRHKKCMAKIVDALAINFEAQLQDLRTKSATRSLLRGLSAKT